MDKRDAIKRLYSRGIMLSPKELENLSEEGLEKLLRPGDDKKEAFSDSRGLSVKLKKHTKKKKLSPQDFIDHYNNKYEKLRTLILKKMDAVSITNAKTGPSPCGIIGIVRGITQVGFIFEDQTGEIEVVRSGIAELEKIEPDDVLGLKGLSREGKFFPREVIWPGMPPNHKTGRINNMNVTLSGNDPPALTLGGKNIRIAESPEWIYISRSQDTVIILAFRASNTTREDAVSYLKKRSLPEPSPPASPNPACLIEEIPDILWLIQDQEWTETHQGVTIISCSSHAKLNLETKKAEFSRAQRTPMPSAPLTH